LIRIDLSNYPKAKSLPVLVVGCFLLTFIGCGGSDEDETELPPEPFAEKISNVIISDTLVYFSVEVEDGRFELLGTEPLTGQLTRISDTVSAHSALHPVGLSPNQLQIAYRADKDNDGFDELYANLVDGTQEVQLSSRLETNAVNSVNPDRINWQWFSDSSRIIFRSDPDNDDIFEIQTILSDGTELAEASGALSVTCVEQNCWQISEDASYLTFKTESLNETSQVSQNLYSVLADGTGLIQLNQTLDPDSRIIDWQFAPDSSLIAYISENIGQLKQLYLIAPDATGRVLFNTESLTTGVTEFQWSPISTQITFADDRLTAANQSLFIGDIDGTNQLHLIDTFEVASPNLVDWQWSPDGSHVAYRADQETSGLVELFTVPVSAQWHRRINPLMPSSGRIQDQWAWSPASDFVAFFAEVDVQNSYDELYLGSTDATLLSQANQLHPTLLNIESPQWTSDGSRLLYSTLAINGQLSGLYSVTTNGTNIVQLNPALESNETIGLDYQLSPDNLNAAFTITSSTTNNKTLHLGGVNSTNQVELVSLGDVQQFFWLNDSSRIVYVVKLDGELSEQIYSVLPDGTDKIRLY
jgi:hypothetical protein